MFTELKEEMELLALHQELNKLKLEMRSAEKWIDRARETIEALEVQIWTLEHRYVPM